MNDILWHLDDVFLSMVESPVLILGAVFAAITAAAVLLTVRSLRDSDDA